MQTHDPALAVIGGSGLYTLEGLTDVRTVSVDTPFGSPSDDLIEGRLGNRRVLFLVRHGLGHRFSPSDVPYRANIYALKALGAEWVIGVSAVGSLREEVAPGDVVVPTQIVDRTRGIRPATFFGAGCVAHVQFGDPYCSDLRKTLIEAARRQHATRVHPAATYVCMEGPQFSTRAESELYRSWHADVIGMTNLPEAKLAREAQLCYASLCLVTDYDCWHEAEADVSVDLVLQVLHRNVALAKRIVADAAPHISEPRACTCRHALRGAVITARERIAPEQRERLALLLREIDG